MFDRSEYICSDQSSDFFHQLYNNSKKILYETQLNIYLESARRDLQNGVKIFVKFFKELKILLKLKKKIYNFYFFKF